mgnify:CR=1 FL=1
MKNYYSTILKYKLSLSPSKNSPQPDVLAAGSVGLVNTLI